MRLRGFVLMVVALALAGLVRAGDPATGNEKEGASAKGVAAELSLPSPRTDGGAPLLTALRNRQSARSFEARELSTQMLADLLWAAAGINRPESGKRTAPSARNWQEVEVYALLKDGAWLYDAPSNTLKHVAAGDHRSLAGVQDFVGSAPLNLVYVADLNRMKDAAPEDRALYTGADTGFIAQNVYLFCASEGLATVVRGSVDRAKLGAALRLPETKRIVLAQTVGYPAAK